MVGVAANALVKCRVWEEVGLTDDKSSCCFLEQLDGILMHI